MMEVVAGNICQDGDLNSGHEDFQSSALPTELSRRVAVELGNLTNIASPSQLCKQFDEIVGLVVG
jgi:hypothetical protein